MNRPLSFRKQDMTLAPPLAMHAIARPLADEPDTRHALDDLIAAVF